MDVYATFYYPVVYGESLVLDESLPLVDKVLSVKKGGLGGDIFKSISFTIYRWDNVFIVKHSVDFLHKVSEEDLFLTVLTVNHKKVAIIDCVDLTRGSVFILPPYLLDDYLASLIRKDWAVFLTPESEVDKKKRRFGFNFSCLKNRFKEEWKGLKDGDKKGDEK
jgi:hypothetical protein